MPHASLLVRLLLDYLALGQPPAVEHAWQAWRIRPVPSGNNRLFRATCSDADWVVKFAIRDDRDRARREVNALILLDRLAPGVAPRSIVCDLDRYEQPVVVQTWVEGTPVWLPPTGDSAWLKILQVYRRVHAILPADVERLGLPAGPLLGPWAPVEQVAAIVAYARQLPPAGQSARLVELMDTLQRMGFPSLPHTQCWGHGDPNVRNIILAEQGAVLVDWEYSGITDPAHEMAKLMSHALVSAAGEDRLQWLAEQYAALSGAAGMLARIRLHYALCLASWYVRLLFGYHVLLQQPSRRLVGHGPEAEISTLANIDLYFDRAMRQLAQVAN
jgi:aminoglycoside phosphotransferase (APT) family kinase protein